MIRGRLLNSEIISVLAAMGHTDQLVIADAGLPIPAAVKRIDLALEKGLPSFSGNIRDVYQGSVPGMLLT